MKNKPFEHRFTENRIIQRRESGGRRNETKRGRDDNDGRRQGQRRKK